MSCEICMGQRPAGLDDQCLWRPRSRHRASWCLLAELQQGWSRKQACAQPRLSRGSPAGACRLPRTFVTFIARGQRRWPSRAAPSSSPWWWGSLPGLRTAWPCSVSCDPALLSERRCQPARPLPPPDPAVAAARLAVAKHFPPHARAVALMHQFLPVAWLQAHPAAAWC